MGPADEGGIFPGVERIMKFAPGRKLVPDLAESVVEDADALTITVKLNKGIMFHDGTELTASVAKWNYDIGAAGGKLQFADAIKEFEIVDDYNYVLHLSYWHNQLLQSLGWVPMFSQAAFEANGGEEWAMTHLVGTGPFLLKDVQPRPESGVGEEPQLLARRPAVSRRYRSHPHPRPRDGLRGLPGGPGRHLAGCRRPRPRPR